MKVSAFVIGLAAVSLGGCVYHHETVRERPPPAPREDQLAGAFRLATPEAGTVLAYSEMSNGAALAAPRGEETGISL